ncbi:molybdopterin converting factor subunit 1 [Peribacillus alkalitolerans]|uniref:molybdopterin converting factor subunit 1 n=1 Tax=Peribacillus alkalitolerans TaxID=1550385 RepID=UPI0013D1C04A|nr:molybdopterin converting factor subunit 1 [Peribacillus alkalitolerans]
MIRILFFAHLKEAVGLAEMEWLGEGNSLEELKKHLHRELGLEGLASVMTAVNEEFADDETMLKAGDVVAFIPPVSGG